MKCLFNKSFEWFHRVIFLCRGRSGKVQAQSMKIGLLSLSKGHLEDKYKCMLHNDIRVIQKVSAWSGEVMKITMKINTLYALNRTVDMCYMGRRKFGQVSHLEIIGFQKIGS